MRILVIYSRYEIKERKTISQYLNSFKKYDNLNTYYYISVTSAFSLPRLFQRINFDVIIFHYTFLAGERFLEGEEGWLKKISGTEKLNGFKIAMPQDEMDHTDRLCKFFKDSKIDAVGTCYYKPEDIELAYPYDKAGVKQFFEVYTGYVDEDMIKQLKYLEPYKSRPIDIGYRARKLAPNYGIHAQLKYRLLEVFEEELKGSDLIYDLNSTNRTYSDQDKSLVKLGNEWFVFLMNCKSFLGCEGGSSLLDADGQVKASVNNYLSIHPEASFDEVEEACFKGKDNSISLFALSPRHFEAAMTKTLQILVEGYYGGIFEAGKHYIVVKKDFSNIKEVLETLSNADKCEQIIESCYRDIVLSGKYTYASFVKKVINEVPKRYISSKRNFSILTSVSISSLVYLRHFGLMFHLYFNSFALRIYIKYFQNLFRKYFKPTLIKLKII